MNVKYSNVNIIIAKDLVASLHKNAGIETNDIVKEMKGNKLIGLTVRHPIFNDKIPILHSEYVNMKIGTGLVHTAPDHGLEDFKTYNSLSCYKSL